MIIKFAIVLLATFLLSTFFRMIVSDLCDDRKPGDTPLCVLVVLILCITYIYLMVLLIKILFIL
jgi:hypothetical protein